MYARFGLSLYVQLFTLSPFAHWLYQPVLQLPGNTLAVPGRYETGIFRNTGYPVNIAMADMHQGAFMIVRAACNDKYASLHT
jgi:hypothetical protein